MIEFPQESPIEICDTPHRPKKRDKAFVFFAGKQFGRGMFHFNVMGLRLGRPSLFVRDRSNAWYDTPDYESACLEIAAWIKATGLKRVIFVGSSAGGYAALKFGIDMIPARAFAFSPQSGSGQRDLPADFRTHAKYTDSPFRADIYYCLRSEQSRDIQFADSMTGIEGVTIHGRNCNTHKIMGILNDSGEMQKILEAA